MVVKETNLRGCFVIEPDVFVDDRGYFYESFNQNKFNNAIGLDIKFVQDNESFSTKGTLRGLHYQIGEHAQAKLVRVVHGEVLDVVVDIRKNSRTYGKYISQKLSGESKSQLFIPRGFAHGFVVLSETAIFSYRCDNFYNKASEGGIIYNDSTLNIDWLVPHSELLISQKDVVLPKLENAIT